MKINRLTKDILVFENFLTNKECESIIKLLDNKALKEEFKWVPISFYESYASSLPSDNDPALKEHDLEPTFFSDLKKRIIENVSLIDNLKTSSIFEIGYHTQKWEPGAYARAHSDNTDEHGNPSAFERSKYAAFVYLNDDFEGGVLNFIKNGISIKPQTGLLAVFNGGFDNMHEVTLVTKGVRYTIGSFWDNKDESEYSEELRNSWKEELKSVREKQEIEKKEWQNLLQQGYKLDKQGKKYKIDSV